MCSSDLGHAFHLELQHPSTSYPTPGGVGYAFTLALFSLARKGLAPSGRWAREEALPPGRCLRSAKHPTAAFAAVGAPKGSFPSFIAGNPCCEINAQPLSPRKPLYRGPMLAQAGMGWPQAQRASLTPDTFCKIGRAHV